LREDILIEFFAGNFTAFMNIHQKVSQYDHSEKTNSIRPLRKKGMKIWKNTETDGLNL